MDLGSGASVSLVARRYGLSADSVGRHIRNNHGVDSEVISLIEGLEDSSDILQRLVEIADSARNVRRQMLAVGNSLGAARAADGELKALQVMASQMGVRDSSVLDALRYTRELISGVQELVTRHPRVGSELGDIFEKQQAHDLAGQIRVLVHQVTEKGEIAK